MARTFLAPWRARTTLESHLARSLAPDHSSQCRSVSRDGRLEHPFVGTGHLLLGLLREGNGIAVGILESRGLTADELRQNLEALQTARYLRAEKIPKGGLDLEDLRNATLQALARRDAPLRDVATEARKTTCRRVLRAVPHLAQRERAAFFSTCAG